MMMTTPVRNLTLTTHVITSVGWLGALAVFLTHALASVISQDEQMVRAASLAMSLTAWFVILPLSSPHWQPVSSRRWVLRGGLLRLYWILFKLLPTSVPASSCC
jgi:hypothetical protein